MLVRQFLFLPLCEESTCVTITSNPTTPGTARGAQHKTAYGFSAYVNGLGSSDYVEIDEWTADAEL